MGYYAKVLDGKVVQVIVAEPDFFETFVDTSPGLWIQTDCNTVGGAHLSGGVPLRKNFAGVGFSYDPVRDAFIPPCPKEGSVLNEETCLWETPSPDPDEDILAQLAELEAMQTPRLLREAMMGLTCTVNKPGCCIHGLTPSEALAAIGAQADALRAQLSHAVYYQGGTT
jgi:hypothetical protein